jgi:hypothetical protein
MASTNPPDPIRVFAVTGVRGGDLPDLWHSHDAKHSDLQRRPVAQLIED